MMDKFKWILAVDSDMNLLLLQKLLVFFFISALSDFLLNQSQPKIFVGDPHQQIYSFRGAINAMQAVKATKIYCLTQVGILCLYIMQMLNVSIKRE